jgi:hypothetical protein
MIRGILGSWYYNCSYFVQNLYTFIGLAWKWRPWDYEYTIDVLVILLKKQAVCIRYGITKDSEKVYRRCMTAAGKLDKAYSGELDRVLSYLMDKNDAYISRSRSGITLKTKYITDERIYKGMYKVASKRSTKTESHLKKDAWKYLSKYIHHFWD